MLEGMGILIKEWKMVQSKEPVEAKSKGSAGDIYVVTNDCYVKVKSPFTGEKVRPVKIGRGKDFATRLGNMSPGVFDDFTIHMVLHAIDYVRCEDDIHDLFKDYRILTRKSNSRTEFFSCPLKEVFARIKKYVAKNPSLISTREDFGLEGKSLGRSAVSQKAALKKQAEAKVQRKLRAQKPAEGDRRGPFQFSMCGIKPGEKVAFVRDASKQAEVVDDRHVRYGKETTSLSMLAKQLTGLKHELQGPIYFTYKGELLDDLRKRLEK